LSNTLPLPVLKELFPDDIEYGTVLLVEFGPDSMWYETSLSIAGQALRMGIRTQYHTFQRMPTEIRQAFASFGLDVKKLEDGGLLQVIDSYTAQTGLGTPEGGTSSVTSGSLKLSDWSIRAAHAIKGGYPEEGKRWLHIDDNTSILSKYNSENAIIEYWRTRDIPEARASEDVTLHSLLTGSTTDAFRNQFESLHDGIVDFKTEEKGRKRRRRIEHYVSARILRGKRYSSRWRRIRLMKNGEVALAD
jgi:KaiC/GvpD/RAD55 family RecA-like ATPase